MAGDTPHTLPPPPPPDDVTTTDVWRGRVRGMAVRHGDIVRDGDGILFGITIHRRARRAAW